MLSESNIDSVIVSKFEKRDVFNVFFLDVFLSDGSRHRVTRRYSDFASLHRSLAYVPDSLSKCSSLPDFPLWKDLFSRMCRGGTVTYCVHLDQMTAYCNDVLNSLRDSLIVQEFFTTSSFDLDLRRRILKMTPTQPNIHIPTGRSLPEYVVIADFWDQVTNFSVRAGKVVVKFGEDGLGWCLVGLAATDDVVHGWMPEMYLLSKEEDEFGEDIHAYLRDLENDMEQKKSGKVLNSSTIFHQAHVREDYFMITVADDDQPQLLCAGMAVTVVDLDADGWWFVCSKAGEEGWFPATLLELQSPSSLEDKDDVCTSEEPFAKSSKMCFAVVEFAAKEPDEASFSKGARLEVLSKSMSGWWTVRQYRCVGLCPAIVLEDDMSSGTQWLYRVGFHSSLSSHIPPRRPEKRCNPERGADIYPNLLQLSSLACASTNSRLPEKGFRDRRMSRTLTQREFILQSLMQPRQLLRCYQTICN